MDHELSYSKLENLQNATMNTISKSKYTLSSTGKGSASLTVRRPSTPSISKQTTSQYSTSSSKSLISDRAVNNLLNTIEKTTTPIRKKK